MNKIEKKITLISIMAEDLKNNVDQYTALCKNKGRKWVLCPWGELQPGEKYDHIKTDIRRLRRELLVLYKQIEEGVDNE